MKKCVQCGNMFSVKGRSASRAAHAKFCSIKCRNRNNSERFLKEAPKKICVQCGTKYVLRQKLKWVVARSRWCSRKCWAEWVSAKVKRVLKKCLQCRKFFRVKVADIRRFSRKRTWEFCSRKCQADSGRMSTVCHYCGKPLIRPKSHRVRKMSYCDMTCLAKDKNTSVTVPCSFCGKPVKVQQKMLKRYSMHYCGNSCRIKDSVGFDFYVDSRSKAVSYRLRSMKEYRYWRDSVLDTGRFCSNCGEKKRLHVHHHPVSLWRIISDNMFDFDRSLTDPRFTAVNNGKILCVGCHREIHKNRKKR